MEVPSDVHMGMLLYLTAAGLVVLIPQLPAAAERATDKERAVVAGTDKERAVVAVRGLAGMLIGSTLSITSPVSITSPLLMRFACWKLQVCCLVVCFLVYALWSLVVYLVNGVCVDSCQWHMCRLLSMAYV